MAKKSTKIDDQLAEHLKQAEHHLIGAVKLFASETMSRRVGYLSRLVRAQELITTLYREELVRIRGSRKGGKGIGKRGKGVSGGQGVEGRNRY